MTAINDPSAFGTTTLGNETIYSTYHGGRPVPPHVVPPPPLDAKTADLLSPQHTGAVQPPLPDSPDEAADASLLKELKRVTAAVATDTAASLSKGELATVLEGFAKVLRADANYTNISYMEHTTAVAELKELLLEAQETIINLLNDRVFDRAKLARLEAEVKLLPDMQAQANRAMGLVMQSEAVQQEIAHVRAEVERLRTSYMRNEQTSGSWLTRLFKGRA